MGIWLHCTLNRLLRILLGMRSMHWHNISVTFWRHRPPISSIPSMIPSEKVRILSVATPLASGKVFPLPSLMVSGSISLTMMHQRSLSSRLNATPGPYNSSLLWICSNLLNGLNLMWLVYLVWFMALNWFMDWCKLSMVNHLMNVLSHFTALSLS